MGSLKELVKFVNGKEGTSTVEYAIIGNCGCYRYCCGNFRDEGQQSI